MPITPSSISIIIPVKDNQRGVDNFLMSFFQTQSKETFPKEIIIVDNNSSDAIIVEESWLKMGVHIQLTQCLKPGPAAARNVGAGLASGRWLLFLDSDCISTPSIIDGYLAQDGLALCYQGFISALGNDYLSNYYMSQQIHLPPTDPNGSPKYLVTANSLVLKEAFKKVGGFNENFKLAAGEDIELAIKLAELGQIAYARESKVIHDFNDGLSGFVKRFIRYGKGNRLVREFHNVNLIPLPSSAKKKSILINNLLVILQWLCLLLGYVQESIELIEKKTPITETDSSENSSGTANQDH